MIFIEYVQRIVAIHDGDGAVALIDRKGVIARLHLNRSVPGLNGKRLIAVNRMGAGALLDGDRFVAFGNGLRPVLIHRDRLILHDMVVLIVLDPHRHVLLSTHVKNLAPHRIVEGQYVGIVCSSSLGAMGAEATDVLITGQAAWRHLLGVVHRTDNNRVVEIAFLEVDIDLLANPGKKHCSPGIAGPNLRNAGPCRAGSVTGPGEHNLNPAIFIRVDLSIANDNCGVEAVAGGPRGHTQRAERN